MGKEAATPSRTWQLLSSARPEMVLFLAVTAKQQSVEQKIKNYLTKWRQVQQKIPLPEMTELLITPQLPIYPKLAHDVFMLLLDGKLRSRTETLKFLKPFAPPPPPPPPAPRRGRAAKGAAEVPPQPHRQGSPVQKGRRERCRRSRARRATSSRLLRSNNPKRPKNPSPQSPSPSPQNPPRSQRRSRPPNRPEKSQGTILAPCATTKLKKK
jgi:hypothetical protein